MILPFTTNQWNAIRFVVLNLISIPLIELALHKLHQLGVANRMLRGRKVRLRPSFLANWGLHQEVDELSVRSRVTAFIVAFCYVGFSLYTEYASGSVPKKSEWKPPVMQRSFLQGKPALFDTTIMSVGAFHGCRSKKSREKLQELLEHTVNVKVRRYVNMTKDNRIYKASTASFYHVGDNGNGRVFLAFNYTEENLHHVAFLYRKHWNSYNVVAEMRGEEVCFRLLVWSTRFVCFSNSENITLRMVLGNIILFDGSLQWYTVSPGYRTLPSASAFDFQCQGARDIAQRNCDAFALARTPSAYLNALRKLKGDQKRRLSFYLKFKYDFGVTDYVCNETPRIEPPILKVPAEANLSRFYDPDQNRDPSVRYQQTRHPPFEKWKFSHPKFDRWFGVFHRKLFFSEDLHFSVVHCSRYARRTGSLSFCAARHADGAISLSRVGYGLSERNSRNSTVKQFRYFLYWTLNWTGQDLQLADLSRAALAYSIAAKELVGRRGHSADSISNALKKGIPKLTQVGSPGVTYDMIYGDNHDSATVYAWVLGVWTALLLVAVNYLVFVKLSKVRLFPDVYSLYCQSVMRRHTQYNNGKRIRTAPTAGMASANGIVELDISYDEVSAGDVEVNDMLQ